MSSDSESTSERDETVELQAQVELLRHENKRLRRETRRAKQVTHRRAAIALAGVGVLAGGAGLLLPTVRELLIALSGIGLFGAVLTYYLTPEQVLTADVSERVYTALVQNEQAVVSELDLSDEMVYLPSTESGNIRLFVPHYADYQLPAREELRSFFVVSESGHERGVAFTPAGKLLFEEFTETVSVSEASFDEYVSQLTDAAVHSFELASAIEYSSDASQGRLTIECTNPAYDGATQFDHPITSFVAVGIAARLGCPVSTTTTFDAGVLTTIYLWDTEMKDE